MKPTRITLDGKSLEALLVLPSGARGLVLFAHGSGSGRLSTRNQFMAQKLAQAGFASLLADLLTEDEDQDYRRRFDIALLTARMTALTRWTSQQPDLASLPLGYFGASTGAAAALNAAAEPGSSVRSIVSRGGRPDLADQLEQVAAPTLLLVGGNDDAVLDLHHQMLPRLQCQKELQVVAGASHLFEEPGTLEQVAKLSTEWFSRTL